MTMYHLHYPSQTFTYEQGLVYEIGNNYFCPVSRKVCPNPGLKHMLQRYFQRSRCRKVARSPKRFHSAQYYLESQISRSKC